MYCTTTSAPGRRYVHGRLDPSAASEWEMQTQEWDEFKAFLFLISLCLAQWSRKSSGPSKYVLLLDGEELKFDCMLLFLILLAGDEK